VRWIVISWLACACGQDAPVLRPFIEVPDGTDPYAPLEDVELSVARRGETTAIVAASFRPGQTLALSDVPFDDDLVVHMSGHDRGGSELAYGRTCPVDLSGATLPGDPHLYFASVLTSALTVPPAADPVREDALAYSLSDGSALFIGGGDLVDTAVRFRPLDGTFERLIPTVAARHGAVVAPVADGDDRALVVGGIQGTDAVDFLELLNPTAGIDQQVQLIFGGPHTAEQAAVTLVGGGVLVTGGSTQADPTSTFVPSAAAWIFRLGQFGSVDLIDGVGSLTAARVGASLTRLDDEVGVVLLTGGRTADGSDAVPSSEWFIPATRTFEAGPEMRTPRWGHQAVRLRGGYVLIVGGFRKDAVDGIVPVTALELYDRSRAQFMPLVDLPETAGANGLTATVLPDDSVLLAGGIDAAGQATETAWLGRIDEAGAFQLTPVPGGLAQARAGHAAAVLCDGTVLLVGGTDAAATTSERFNPPSSGRR